MMPRTKVSGLVFQQGPDGHSFTYCLPASLTLERAFKCEAPLGTNDTCSSFDFPLLLTGVLTKASSFCHSFVLVVLCATSTSSMFSWKTAGLRVGT